MNSSNDTLQYFKKYGRRSSVAFIGIVICVAIGFYIIVKSAEHRTEKGTYGNCHRLNIVRSVDNENYYIGYTFYKSVLTLLDKSITLKKNISKQEIETDNAFLIPLKNIVDKTKWIPLTNCMEAVSHPFTYIPPEPIEFSKQSPSKYAFELGPDN